MTAAAFVSTPALVLSPSLTAASVLMPGTAASRTDVGLGVAEEGGGAVERIGPDRSLDHGAAADPRVVYPPPHQVVTRAAYWSAASSHVKCPASMMSSLLVGSR